MGEESRLVLGGKWSLLLLADRLFIFGRDQSD
jgi:hypothetical protein